MSQGKKAKPMIKIIAALILVVGCTTNPLVDPIGTWHTQLTPGSGDCGFAAQDFTRVVTEAGGGVAGAYAIGGAPTNAAIYGSITCDSQMCQMATVETTDYSALNVTLTLRTDDKISGSGTITYHTPSPACSQELVFVGMIQ